MPRGSRAKASNTKATTRAEADSRETISLDISDSEPEVIANPARHNEDRSLQGGYFYLSVLRELKIGLVAAIQSGTLDRRAVARSVDSTDSQVPAGKAADIAHFFTVKSSGGAMRECLECL